MRRPGEPILAIVGASEAPSQDTGTLSPGALMAEATGAALDGCAVTLRDVDALFSASAYHYMPTLTLGETLRVVPRYSDSSTIGGTSFVAHLGHAANVIAAGECNVGLIAYGSTQRSDGGRFVRSMTEPLAYETPYGALWPIAGYALLAQRHMYEFATTPAQLAEVAVAARAWAALNPSARERDPITVDDVLASPVIADPLHRLDCCLVTDGAGALVVAAPERAADLCERPIYVYAVEEAHVARYITGIEDLTTSPAAITGPRALAKAGVTLDDVDVFHLYDSFTIAVILTLEGLGLCPRGEGGRFVEDGKLRPGGGLAVNTNGGGLSNRHPGMLGMFLLLEAIAQLRHEAGRRQIDGASVALVHGLGGVHMSGVTAILSRRPSLG